MQRTMVPTTIIPAHLVVPDAHAGNLCYAPLTGDPLLASTVLPTMYLHDREAFRGDPEWVSPSLLCPTLDAVLQDAPNAFVRRYEEQTRSWGMWYEGRVVGQRTSRRVIGPLRHFLVEYETEDGRTVREEFVPYLGELCNAPPISFSPEQYLQRRQFLNLVYIPILTKTAGLWPTQPERAHTVVFYTGQVLWTNSTWSEHHVRVLAGPYTGLVLRSAHACAFTPANAAAIENARDGACVYARLPRALGADAAVRLPVEHAARLVLPRGHGWASVAALGPVIREEEARRDPHARVAHMRAGYFDWVAEALPPSPQASPWSAAGDVSQTPPAV